MVCGNFTPVTAPSAMLYNRNRQADVQTHVEGFTYQIRRDDGSVVSFNIRVTEMQWLPDSNGRRRWYVTGISTVPVSADATSSADGGTATAPPPDAGTSTDGGTATTPPPDAGTIPPSDGGSVTPPPTATTSTDGGTVSPPTGTTATSPTTSGSGGTSSSGSGSGSGSGAPPEERTFWNRGGRTLLIGLGLVALGILTVATGGGALIVATGVMTAVAGGVMAGGSAGLMYQSYSGNTTAEEDRQTMEFLSDVGLVGSSPFGLAGGAIGYAVNGREGMRTGALIGNIAQIGYTGAQLGLRALAARGAAHGSTATTSGSLLSSSGNYGVTSSAGAITVDASLTGTQLTETLVHEGVHRLLTPLGTDALTVARQNLGAWGYSNSHLLRFTEELLAESAATGNILRSAEFAAGYVSMPRLFLEAAAYLGITIGPGYAAYQLSK